jgi:SAM-dependent methyltransferase
MHAPEPTPAQAWEERYAGSARVWSGRPNATLVDVAGTLTPGRALDLGCGEGGDAIWLAQQGWVVTGLDISTTAVRRATDAARALGLPGGRVRFVAVDLEDWSDDGTYDLVTASFLHSHVALSRTEVLRRAAERVAPGGHLLVVSHAAPPPWSQHHEADRAGSADADDHADRADHADHTDHADHADHAHRHDFLDPHEELEALALDRHRWTPVLAEMRTRPATGPDGEETTLEDAVVLLRRGTPGNL